MEVNRTLVTAFILRGITDLPELQVPMFLVFFFIYVTTMVGNLGLIVLIWKDPRLHTPMYFFLGSLAFADACTSSSVTPRMLVNILDNAVTFMSIAVSYAHVLFSILKTKSEKGRRKAFSTCSAHLLSVSLFYGTLFFMYVSPGSGPSKYKNKMYSLFYTIVIPLLNPFIYSLRNKEVLGALRKIMKP